MTRVLLLLLFLLWLVAGEHQGASVPLVGPGWGLGLFLGVFGLLVVGTGLWGRLLARRVSGANLHRSLGRFNHIMFYARALIPVWFAFGIFSLRWYDVVAEGFGRLSDWQSLFLVIGTAPALLTWMGLWWSQYPADRALREQSLLTALDENLPVHAAPSFRSYFTTNLRLQLLFTLVPVLLIVLLRDVLVASARVAGFGPVPVEVEAIVNLSSTAVVFIFAPQILRYVLATQRLEESPLRRKLEAMCRRFGLRYNDILIWRTQNNMGNAAVVGIVPRLRYILLSDLLLETMDDRQIEAVFAHEMGHIVHRHMLWYVLFFVTMTLALGGPGAWVAEQLESWAPRAGWASELARLSPWLFMMAGVGLFLLVFGFLSRCFERQADVFAARTMQAALEAAYEPVMVGSGKWVVGSGRKEGEEAGPPAVGPAGAALFASALERVALVNNIPVGARSWCHGSIAGRMEHLRRLSEDPARTGRFDRFMGRVYALLLTALFAAVGYLVAGG